MFTRLSSSIAVFVLGTALSAGTLSGAASAAPLSGESNMTAVEQGVQSPVPLTVISVDRPIHRPMQKSTEILSATSILQAAFKARGNHRPKGKTTWTTHAVDERSKKRLVVDIKWKQAKKAKFEHPLSVRIRQYKKVCVGFWKFKKCEWRGAHLDDTAFMCFNTHNSCKGGPAKNLGVIRVPLKDADNKWTFDGRIINLNPNDLNAPHNSGIYASVLVGPDNNAEHDLIARAED
jgi:hypothetical protein